VCDFSLEPASGTKIDYKHSYEIEFKNPRRTESRRYPTGTQTSDAEVASLNLKRSDFCGKWSYTLMPSLE
jgi:hypothetical protein